MPKFSEQEIMQAHALQNILLEKGSLVSSKLTFEHHSKQHLRRLQGSSKQTFHPHPP
jgi:hypothetical protein